MSKLRKIKAEYVSAHGKDPSNAEVARLSGLTEEKVLYFASLYNPVVSLDQPMGKDKDGASLQEGLAVSHSAGGGGQESQRVGSGRGGRALAAGAPQSQGIFQGLGCL